METTRAESKPHTASKGNFEIAKNLMKVYEFNAPWDFKFHDYDVHTNMIKDIKYLEIYGKHNKMKYSYPISFHQGTIEFEKELGDHLRMLEFRGLIEKKGSKHKDLLPSDRHKKKALHFSKMYPATTNPFECVIAHEDYVEIRFETKMLKVNYNLSDEEWHAKTLWKI